MQIARQESVMMLELQDVHRRVFVIIYYDHLANLCSPALFRQEKQSLIKRFEADQALTQQKVCNCRLQNHFISCDILLEAGSK